MSILFLWREELVIVTFAVWNKRPESFLQNTRGQQGCQFGFFEARFCNFGFFWTPLAFLAIKKARLNLAFSERLGSSKILSELHIHYKSLLTRACDHAGYTEYCKYFTVALKMIDVIDKNQMHDSVIAGKENASEDWNCIISMFLTRFKVYFGFGLHVLCVYALKLLSVIFLGDKVWLFLVKIVW